MNTSQIPPRAPAPGDGPRATGHRPRATAGGRRSAVRGPSSVARDLRLLRSSPRARRLLLASPALFSVTVRWLAWIESVLFVGFGNLDPVNTRHEPWLHVVTFGILALYTLYVPVLRGLVAETRLLTPGFRAVLEHGALLSALDILTGLAVIWLSGGWGSPHYRFGMTAVILPSLRFGLPGALLAAAGFSAGYFAVVATAGHGFGPVTGNDRWDWLIGALFDPFLVAVFCAYLATVLRGLRAEQATSDRALRETARLTRERAALIAQQERSRLARDIHDGIAQHLYMLTLSLEACLELAQREAAARPTQPAARSPQPSALPERLAQLLALSKQALWEVRHYIHDLKPMLSGDYSLTATLQNQVKEFRAISGLEADLRVTGEEPPLPAPVRAALYRLAQEALANVFKHARATRVEIAVHYTPDGVALDVLDDGVGLPPGCEAAAPAGYGLASMRERAAELGGTLTLANRPQGGLHLHTTLPYGSNRQDARTPGR